jgi:hypothetical protein
MQTGFTVIIVAFLVYYLLVLFKERRLIRSPKKIIEKFLSMILLYAGISLIWYSLTGKPFLKDPVETYSIYIFMIGFIAVLWTIPNLLVEFAFFRNFFEKRKKAKEAKVKEKKV